VLRRQAQEADVHTVDVEQVLGDVGPNPRRRRPRRHRRVLDVMVPVLCPTGRREAHPVVLHAATPTPNGTLFPDSRPLPIATLTAPPSDLLMTDRKCGARVPMGRCFTSRDAPQAARCSACGAGE
jgi:hypothetical protein